MCRLDLKEEGHILVLAEQKAGRNLVSNESVSGFMKERNHISSQLPTSGPKQEGEQDYLIYATDILGFLYP